VSQQAQNYDNHAHLTLLFHKIAFPILALNVFVTAYFAVRGPSFQTIWQVVLAVGLVVLLFSARLMALTVQDRVIRLEERLRLKRLLPELSHEYIEGITVEQLIGLRFAPDDEVPELVRRMQTGDLTDRKSVKQAVQNWRADHLRA